MATDYILCDRKVKDQLVKELKKQIVQQFGSEPLKNKDYGKIINEKHFNRLCGLIDNQKTVIGGNINKDTLQIVPTVMDEVSWEDAVMQ